jgi:hypothetical protein
VLQTGGQRAELRLTRQEGENDRLPAKCRSGQAHPRYGRRGSLQRGDLVRPACPSSGDAADVRQRPAISGTQCPDDDLLLAGLAVPAGRSEAAGAGGQRGDSRVGLGQPESRLPPGHAAISRELGEGRGSGRKNSE